MSLLSQWRNYNKYGAREVGANGNTCLKHHSRGLFVPKNLRKNLQNQIKDHLRLLYSYATIPSYQKRWLLIPRTYSNMTIFSKQIDFTLKRCMKRLISLLDSTSIAFSKFPSFPWEGHSTNGASNLTKSTCNRNT